MPHVGKLSKYIMYLDSSLKIREPVVLILPLIVVSEFNVVWPVTVNVPVNVPPDNCKYLSSWLWFVDVEIVIFYDPSNVAEPVTAPESYIVR